MNTALNLGNDAMVAEEIYLYCLAYPECIPIITGLQEREIYGIDETQPVFFLEQDGIVAVIGHASSSEFNEKNLGDLDWIGVRGSRHEQVVEAVMENSPVVPVRFGTLFHSRTTLSRFLNRNSKIVSRILNALQGKAEWSIKGYLNTDAASRKITAENVEIQTGLATLSPSPGVRYLQQKKLDGMVKSEMSAWIEHLIHSIDATLASSSLGMAELRLLEQPAPTQGERMIFHRSFLVCNQNLAVFRAIVGEQAESHSNDGLRLELRGPWPPHNFCPDLVDGDLANPEISS